MEAFFDFRAWFNHHMEKNDLSIQQLAELIARQGGGEVSASHSLPRMLNNNLAWTAVQVKIVAEAFGLHWWDEFLQVLRPYGFKTRITLDEADALFHSEGEHLGRVAMVA